MAKCPKCGCEDYTVLVVLDRDSDWDLQTDNFAYFEIDKVQCDNCSHKYSVKEVYTFSHSENV